MVRKLAPMLALTLFLPCVPAFAGDGDGRVSGVLKEIRPDGKLVIEEQGPWHGPGTGLVTRSVAIGPETEIRVVQQKDTWGAADAQPGYDVRAADFRELRPGDFVTVTTTGGAVARSVELARPGDRDAGVASPRTDSMVTK